MGVGTRDQQPIPSAQPTAAPARPDRITLRGAQPLSAIVQRLAADPHPLTRADVAQLQRTFGNAAVSRLLAQRTLLSERAPAGIENHDAAAQQNASPRPAQLRASETAVDHAPATSRKAMSRADGLPEPLKSGIEALSGLAMDDVRVAYGSSAPAIIGSSAFAQGRHIHLGPGQERHLAHEAWHVAQQKQGRVAETMQLCGPAINDDPALEHEADMMGARAAASAVAGGGEARPSSVVPPSPVIIQGVFWKYRYVLENARSDQEAARKRQEDYDEYVKKRGYELWWDTEGKCYYKAVLTGEDFTLFQRFGDGLNVWVANKTGLPVGETDEQKMARLTAPAPRSLGSDETTSTSKESGEVAESGAMDLSDNDEATFEQIEDRSERPSFIAPLPGRTRQEHEKRPSQLTFHVAVQPDEGKDDIHQRYGAGDLLVAALIVSEDRPDTRYGEDQKSHSVAFSLIRVALQNFAGRSVATLLKFLKQGFAELADESELQENAKEIAQGLIPEGYFDSLAEGRAPLDTWNSLLSGMLYHYETVYHLGIVTGTKADGR